MQQVNLFIVGAMKAGTTAFIDMLSKHSMVYFSPVKEPHYFVQDLPSSMYSPSRYFSLQKYLDHEFPKPLHIAHIKTIEQYDKLFSLAPNTAKYLAEGSTGYLHAPESAKLIHSYNPKAKIIILTRDPLKRAYSHYLMNVGLGRESIEFDEAIKRDIDDYYNNQLNPWSYLGMSLYKQNVERYENLFGDNVLVLSLANYHKDQNEFLNVLFEFLQIPFENIHLERKNTSRTIRHKKLQKFIFDSGIRDLAQKFIPPDIRKKLFLQLTSSSKEIEIKKELKQELLKIFKLNE